VTGYCTLDSSFFCQDPLSLNESSQSDLVMSVRNYLIYIQGVSGGIVNLEFYYVRSGCTDTVVGVGGFNP